MDFSPKRQFELRPINYQILIFNTFKYCDFDLNRDIQTFEQLFRELFKPLCGFAVKYVVDLDDARNLVHDVFITVWEKFDSLPSDTNHRSYLYTAVRNRCLNHLRSKKKHMSLEGMAEHKYAEEERPMEADQLEKEIELGINSLPEKCRMVFEMNRKEGLKYSEIAEKMGISVKTVETQMSKALSVLREHLKEFLSLIIILFGR